MGGTKTMVGIVVVLALFAASGTALGAPPSDPPGKSADAPGHQKEPGSPAEPTPPGHAEDVEEPAAPQDVAPVVATPAAPAEEPGPEQSPRFTNASGKSKHNVPAAAEAAPESSISAAGASGRHKLTICHKGHAITVDVHAARAHVDGHGDTYALAGAKGRAACPQTLGPVPPTPAPNETPSGPGGFRPEDPIAVAAVTGRGTNEASVAPAVAADPQTPPKSGVSEAAHEQNGGFAAGVAGVAGMSLPFTGAPLSLVVLFGLALVAGGALLRHASLGWAPARRRR